MATVVECDPKVPFPLATTPLSGLLHFTLDTYLIMLCIKQSSIKYHFFEFLVGLTPGLPGHWWTMKPNRRMGCNQTKNNIYALTPFSYDEVTDACVVRYPTNVKSADFRSQLEAFPVSSHTDELWYNETVCLWIKNIYYYFIIYYQN